MVVVMVTVVEVIVRVVLVVDSVGACVEVRAVVACRVVGGKFMARSSSHSVKFPTSFKNCKSPLS